MNKDTFSVSVKGILFHKGKYLLRKNQRNEFELLGGRLEPEDNSPEERIKKEFIEESGVEVNIEVHREPWLYEIAKKNIIIVPYLCSLVSCPEVLYDNDGGSVCWIEREALDAIHMPRGYIDSIRNVIPRKGFSPLPGDYFKTIPNYTERDYFIKVVLKDLKGQIIVEDYLSHFVNPRDFIKKALGNDYVESDIIALPIIKDGDTVIVNFLEI